MKKILAAIVLSGALFSGVDAAPAQATVSYGAVLAAMCSLIEGNPTVQAFADISRAGWAAGWPSGQAGMISGDAVRQVCPQHLAIARQWANMDDPPPGRYVGFRLPPFQREWEHPWGMN